MGFRHIELKVPTDYSDKELQQRIARELRIRDFTWQIENKSLDARKKGHIHWMLRVAVHSPELRGGVPGEPVMPLFPCRKRNERVVIAGSGPAGFFAALALQMAGFDTLILERGAEVDRRAAEIEAFERGGDFPADANYAFGEGGAGTFSDGKLTSRSKHISRERDFFLRTYVEAGAPAEILYMTHPHVGSDNLRKVVVNLREMYRRLGGEIRFGTTLTDLVAHNGRVREAVAGAESFAADRVIVAPGHSSYETYRMLMDRGVPFRTKNFAIGFRAEHRQEEINQAQWGVPALAGVKAAEYRLTAEGEGGHPVYSFCMCPGGMVVPAATHPGRNIVNGMSLYRRDGRFANAGCVAGLHPDHLAGRETTPREALQRMEELERSFYEFAGGYRAPFCTIGDFLSGRMPGAIPESSYPLGLVPAPLWEMLPGFVIRSLRAGLEEFERKLWGYSRGILLGLESKTSSPVQVVREEDGRCAGFSNLYVAGEGSGYAGGIVSSAADGLRIAVRLAGSDGL